MLFIRRYELLRKCIHSWIARGVSEVEVNVYTVVGIVPFVIESVHIGIFRSLKGHCLSADLR